VLTVAKTFSKSKIVDLLYFARQKSPPKPESSFKLPLRHYYNFINSPIINAAITIA
jgi:hypothetical protein